MAMLEAVLVSLELALFLAIGPYICFSYCLPGGHDNSYRQVNHEMTNSL